MSAIIIRLGILGVRKSKAWKRDAYLRVIKTVEPIKDRPERAEALGIREVTPYEGMVLGGYYSRIRKIKNIISLAENSLAGNFDYSRQARKLRSKLLPRHYKPDGLSADFWFDEFMYKIPVTIDMSLDDETLHSHFKVWLSIQRTFIADRGFRFRSKPLSLEELQHWNRFQVLGAFDLISWRELSGEKYSDAAIASWLWPDGSGDFADRSERLRKVTKPLIDQVMNWNMVERLKNYWLWEIILAEIDKSRGRQET